MLPVSRQSDGIHAISAAFRWGEFWLEIGLSRDGDSRLLEIGPLSEDQLQGSLCSDSQAMRLRCAANIALDLDSTISRLVQSGGTARLSLKVPRRWHGRRLLTLDDVFALRPSVEELIAPLIFDPIPRTSLRPFQEFGVRWLTEHRVGILADDMGLGKTAQALRALEQMVEDGVVRSAMVVCPKSLLANWEVECARWVPRLAAVRVTPSRGDSDKVWSSILGRAHVIITSYEQLRTLPSPFASERVELVISDEAHRLRRTQAKIVQSFKRMSVERMWALTGTPIERHPVDLATLLSLLEPNRFSAKTDDIGVGLRARAEPYMLRRLKRDVLRELPEVIDTTERIELTPQQQRAYSKARTQPLPKEVGEVLQRLTMLRSICDSDPVSGASAKLDRIVEILQEVHYAGEKAVVFSYTLRPLELLADRMTRERPALGAVTLTGRLTADERTRAIERFKSDNNVVALLCSSRVGGEGLTLTEANHVLFINEWWNPSANAQARDRVVRLGQDRVVHVHRFRCQETVEEVLDQILARKNETFASIVDALAIGTQLTETESAELLGEVVGALGPE